jgi:hypothetical protein
VAVPAGSPLDWARAIPALAPALPASSPPDPAAEERTAASSGRPALDPRFSSSSELLRILTLDIASEIEWIQTRPAPGTVTHGGGPARAAPGPGEPLYWVSLVALLRLLLHPSEVPRNELEVHLIELGPAVLPVLESARAEPYLADTCELVASRVAVPPESGELARDARAPLLPATP